MAREYTQQTPDEILKLPASTDTGDLEDHDTIVRQEIIDLFQKFAIPPNSDVLRHLKTSNLVVVTRRLGNITIIHAQNPSSLLGHTILPQTLSTEGSLVSSKGHTGHVDIVVLTSKCGKGTPTTANVQHMVTLLQVEFFTHKSELVVLEFFKSFLAANIGHDTPSVDHTRTEEPRVKVIATVVVVTNLVFILGLRMEDDVGNKLGKNVFEQLKVRGLGGGNNNAGGLD